MTVYVDTMRAPFKRLLLCHMIADTEDELHQMAKAIGIARKWYQGDHYDIGQAKKRQAIALGAVEVSVRRMVELRQMIRSKLGQCPYCGRPMRQCECSDD